MSHKTLLTMAAFLLIGVAIGMVVGWRFSLARHSMDDPSSEHQVGNEDEHNEHSSENVVQLTEEQMKEFGIEVGTAGPGKLHIRTSLPGEVVANADNLVHIVSRVNGVVREVRKKLGDPVGAGEVMAVIESRELADAKAAYLAGLERLALAEANFIREEKLWKRKISSEQEYLSAKQVLAEAQIELRSAEQKLHALGFAEEYLKKLPAEPEALLTRYEITAPFDSTVIAKHISLGEVLTGDSEVFVIADLSSVWVDLGVYQKDLPFIKEGQSVVISAGPGIPKAKGKIAYVGPVVAKETRTALARIILPNPERNWRPGLFVTASITVDQIDVPLLIPKTALQTMDENSVVFVQTDEGFEPQPIFIGRCNETHVEILSGLSPGQRYVTKGGFALKSELSKESFGGHGH